METVENVQMLRESILEALTGVIQGINAPEVLQQGLAQYIDPILAFIKGG